MVKRLWLGRKYLSPWLVFHISHKGAAKAEKRRFFDQKILTGLRVQKTNKEMETACIAAIDT